jgi:hypothetical protein
MSQVFYFYRMTLTRNMTSWLLVSLAIVSRDNNVLIFSATMALIILAGILPHGRCGVLMCTASTEKTTLKDPPGLKSLPGQPTIGTFLRGPLRRDAEQRTSVRIFGIPLRRRNPVTD